MLYDKKPMTLKMRCKIFVSVFVVSMGATTLAHAQTPANQALDSCMQTTTVQGAMAGGIAGALIGNLFGGNKNRGQNTAIGAGVGAVGGGAIAWLGSWASCLKKLNLATSESLKTNDYRSTAQRYNYQGNGVFLKIEEVNVPSPIVAGQSMKADLKYTLLTPEDLETEVQVHRTIVCGSTIIFNNMERYSVTPGTISIPGGDIPIPSNLTNNLGQQNCALQLSVAAAGSEAKWPAVHFSIIPTGSNNQPQANYAQPPVPPPPEQSSDSHFPPPPPPGYQPAPPANPRIGPSIMALPGTGKSFDQFRTDDANCKASAAQGSAPYRTQRDYDRVYVQCMYQSGNQVPTQSLRGN